VDNMMVSIGKYIQANYEDFGLLKPTDLRLTAKSRTTALDPGLNGGHDLDKKLLVMLALRTMPDSTKSVPFGNLINAGVKGERFLTLIEFECKTRAPNLSKEFFWNTARHFRDEVYNSLAGVNRGGIVIPRYDWTGFDMEGDVLLTGAYGPQRGEIWFEVDPGKGSPIEDQLEDPEDSSNKSIFLTYNVHWWRPITS